MDALAFLIPAVATAALGGALLMPIRDDRAGRKATLDGRAPFLADFRNVNIASESEDDLGSEQHAKTTVLEAQATPVPGAIPSPFDPIALVRSVAKRLGSQALEPDVSASEVVTERSFADELSSLLPTPVTEVATPMPSTPAPIEADKISEIAEPPVVQIFQHDAGAAAPAPRTCVVPITRLPLRRQTSGITWPASASPPLAFATDAERYAFLRAAATDCDRADDALLARAFREETAEGRALALVALRRADASREAIDAFTDALCTGSDDERALAVDALSEAGAREQVARGITDRIDAIAAQAALAYVGTSARDDYRAALSPLIDESRIETILALLAGVVE